MNVTNLWYNIDLLYYFYCVKMKMSEHNFWSSPLRKINKMIDMYQDEQSMVISTYNNTEYQSQYFVAEAEEIHSMKEVEGFV